MTTKKSSTLLYSGRVIHLYKEEHDLPNGKKGSFEVARHAPAASVVPISDDGKSILMIKQYRAPIEQWVWEIPAGLVDPGETPEQCARRELEEETGYRAKVVIPIIPMHTSFGFTDEIIHIFKGVGLEKTEKRQEESEVIEEHFFTKQELMKMIENKEITDSKTLVALLWVVQTSL